MTLFTEKVEEFLTNKCRIHLKTKIKLTNLLFLI